MKRLIVILALVAVILSVSNAAPAISVKLSTVCGTSERCAPAAVTFVVSVDPAAEACKVSTVRFLRASSANGCFRQAGTACAPDPFHWQAWEIDTGCPIYRAEALDCTGATLAVSNDLQLKIVACICRCSSNGITVMPPKYYDQRSLESMLDAARKAYSQVAFPNLTELYAKIGGVQGATAEQTITAAAVQIGGSSEKSGAPPELKEPKALIPFEPQFSLAASDILAQQQQLYYEFAGLSLLAENSITDRVLEQSGTGCLDRVYFTPRSRPVIGFNINIEQPPCYADAVADVDVIVCPGSSDSQDSESPFVVNMVPQAKTYNVASMRRDVSSIGFGAVVGMAQLGGAGSRQSESVYLVKDTDTVAFQRARCANDSERAGGAHFAWQFRPVLGQRMLEPASRNVYVTLALPVDCFKPWLAKVFVTTSWHRIVKDRGVWKGVDPNPIEGTVNEQIPMLLYFPSSYSVQKGMRHVENVLWEDAGDGKIAIVILGRFDPGYVISIGGQNVPTEQILAASTGRIKFVVKALDLVRNDPLLLDRFGVASRVYVPERFFVTNECLEIADEPCVKQLDATYSSVTVTIRNKISGRKAVDFMAVPTHRTSGKPATPSEPGTGTYTSNPGELWRADAAGLGHEWAEMGEIPNHKPLFLIGDAVYGLCGSPVTYTDLGDGRVACTMAVPTDQIRRFPELIVKDILWGPSFVVGARLRVCPDFSLTTISETGADPAKKITLAVTGLNLCEKISSYHIYLGDQDLKTLGGAISPLSTDSQLIFTVGKSKLDGIKYIILSKGPGQTPLYVPYPPKNAPPCADPADRP